MKVLKNVKVPTGNILIVEGEKGKLECLSIGDYGKEKNIKADFLGLTSEINGVPNGDIVPLTEKWVITISTQYGCSMGCTFCDVPKVGKGINATRNDLIAQVVSCISLHPEIAYTNRLNLHYARMGEPTFNFDVIKSAWYLKSYLEESKNYKFHPVVSTMMPKNNKYLLQFLDKWLNLKNHFNGEVGLQLSINTTDETIRQKQIPNSLSLRDISDMFCELLQHLEGGLLGRKIALNFALTESPIDAELLETLFGPKYFMCKITPMHMTNACKENQLETKDGYNAYYPYKETEEKLKKVGFDVIVFIPSKEEDESRITCGNAILSDGL